MHFLQKCKNGRTVYIVFMTINLQLTAFDDFYFTAGIWNELHNGWW